MYNDYDYDLYIMILVSKLKLRSASVFGSESELGWSFLESASKQGTKASRGRGLIILTESGAEGGWSSG